MQPVDIMMVSFQRLAFTQKSIAALAEKTRTPFRLIVIDNGSTDGSQEWLREAYLEGLVHELVCGDENLGVHWAKNAGLALIESEPYYIDTDNDIICPNLKPDWISRLLKLMADHPEFESISLRPQVFVGGIPNWSEEHEIVEVPWAGAVLRAMRTKVVREAGGWADVIRQGRNGEERWIAEKLKHLGYKVGFARDLYAFHQFGINWGYPEGTPHGHGEMWPPSEHWDNVRVDPDTLKPL